MMSATFLFLVLFVGIYIALSVRVLNEYEARRCLSAGTHYWG